MRNEQLTGKNPLEMMQEFEGATLNMRHKSNGFEVEVLKGDYDEEGFYFGIRILPTAAQPCLCGEGP
jgi:hypothetical protein